MYEERPEVENCSGRPAVAPDDLTADQIYQLLTDHPETEAFTEADLRSVLESDEEGDGR